MSEGRAYYTLIKCFVMFGIPLIAYIGTRFTKWYTLKHPHKTPVNNHAIMLPDKISKLK